MLWVRGRSLLLVSILFFWAALSKSRTNPNFAICLLSTLFFEQIPPLHVYMSLEQQIGIHDYKSPVLATGFSKLAERGIAIAIVDLDNESMFGQVSRPTSCWAGN